MTASPFAASTLIGESFAGSGPNAAHLNVVIGRKGGPVETAWMTSLATPRAGHVPFLVTLRPNLPVKPATLFVNKADVRGERHETLTWGAAQAGVAAGIAQAVAEDLIPPEDVDDLVVIAAVWVNWTADDETQVFENNRRSTFEAVLNAVRALPEVDQVVAEAGEPWNAYFPGPLTPMRITRIRIARLEHPLDPPFHAAWDPVPRTAFAATLVRVETDEGVTGIGSGDTMDGFESFEHLFLGEDPLRIARHVRAIETITFHAGRYWPLEAALWDLIGKVTGQPVATLFGGALDAIPAYASTGERRSPRDRAESALAIREAGFQAMKIRIDRHHLAEGLAAVRATREAVGDSLELMVDLNAAWRMAGDTSPSLDVVSARRVADELADLGVLWLEEPLDGADLRGLATLRAGGRIRIAGGEMTRSLPEVLAALDADAFDVHQPDVVLAVGMLRARTVAELALARNRWFSPHTWTNGIGVLANLHVAAGVGGGPYLEFPYDPPGWTPERRDFMLAEPVGIDGEGRLNVPRQPGLGIELSDEAVRALDAAP